jgi:hypothetical protein
VTGRREIKKNIIVCVYSIQKKNDRVREEDGVCMYRESERERKFPEESEGKFTNKGVKQKETENKTKQNKQSPDSSLRTAPMLFFFSSAPPHLFFFCWYLSLLFPSFSLHLSPSDYLRPATLWLAPLRLTWGFHTPRVQQEDR